MQINHRLGLTLGITLAAALMLAGCDAARPVARAPVPPVPQRLPEAAPVQPSVVSSPGPRGDWRDAGMAPGEWGWFAHPSGGIAQFGIAGQTPAALVVCDQAAGVIRIALPVSTPAPIGIQPATISTSTSDATVVAEAAVIDGQPTLAITLPATHPVFDAIAFSRGRWRIAIGAVPPMIVPAWPHVARVIEECRNRPASGTSAKD